MCRVAFLLLLLTTAPLCADEDDVSWTDKFLSPDLTSYQAEGDVAWNKRLNGIRLNPNALVAREAVMGFIAEARVDIWLPQGLGPTRGLHVTLRERSAVNFTTVFLGIDEGKPILGVMVYPGVPYPLPQTANDAAGEGPWVLRLRLRYGIVQAKAWRKNQPEPAEWQVTRYTGDSGWEPRMIGVYAGEYAGIVERLHVHGTRPATALFLKPEKELGEKAEPLVERMRKLVLMRKQGNFREALPDARRALGLAVETYGQDHAVTASCIHNLAALLHDNGEYAESLNLFERSLELRRKLLPDDHPYIAASLDGTGAALAFLGRLDEAKKRYQEALALRRRVLGEDHPDTAYSWNNLGQARSLLAEYPEALDCFQHSLKIRRAVLGDKHPDTAKALNNVGYQLFVLGEYLKALPYYEDAVRVYRDVLGPDHPDTATAENNLGYLFKEMGRFAAALERFETALTIYTKAGGPKHPLRAVVLNNQANVYCETGDYIQARALLEEALAIKKEVLGADHPDTAVLQINLAMAIRPTGDDPLAVQLLTDSVKILVDKLPPDHPNLALVLHNLTAYLDGDEDRQFVRNTLEKALIINRTKLGFRHPRTINTLNSLALHLGASGQADEAQKILTDSLRDCEAELGANNPLVALLRHNLSATLYQRGLLMEAEAQCRRALDAFRKSFGNQHPDTARSLNLLATVLAADGRRADALASAAGAAAVYSEVARRLLAGTAESQHARLLDQWRPEVLQFVRLAVTDPDLPGTRTTDLLATVMDWKAASGRALLNRMESLVVGRTPAAAKYEEILVYRRQIVQEIMRGAGSESVENYNSRLATMQERMDALERDVGKQVQEYAALGQSRHAGPAEVARHLPAGAALVEFIHHPRIQQLPGPPIPGVTDDEFYAALVLYRAAGAVEPTIRLVPLGPADPIDNAIRDWRREIQSALRNAETDAELRQKLWSPLAAVLPPNTKRLFLAPDGQLALVPFEALRLEDDKFLIEQYQVSYVTTGRDLIPRPKATQPPGPPVVLADPAYELAGFSADFSRPVVRNAEPTRSLAFSNNPRNQRSLPGFAAEAEAVVKLLTERQQEVSVRYLPRAEATEEGAEIVPRPRLLYFITHGGYMKDQRRNTAMDISSPAGPDLIPGPNGSIVLSLAEFGDDPRLRSVLYLAGCNHWQERAARGLSDGLLTALEVQSLDLWGTELVVASACDTGVGEVRVGEGVLGLRRAFQQAGARTVVSSLWKVPDEQTKKMMPRFLDLWLARTPKAEALRQSQLEIIAELRASKNAQYRDAAPLYWAAFVCHGIAD